MKLFSLASGSLIELLAVLFHVLEFWTGFCLLEHVARHISCQSQVEDLSFDTVPVTVDAVRVEHIKEVRAVDNDVLLHLLFVQFDAPVIASVFGVLCDGIQRADCHAFS